MSTITEQQYERAQQEARKFQRMLIHMAVMDTPWRAMAPQTLQTLRQGIEQQLQECQMALALYEAEHRQGES